MRSGPGKKYRRYRIRRRRVSTKHGTGFRYGMVRSNPAALKKLLVDGLTMYGAILGTRMLSKYIYSKMQTSATFTTGSLASFAAVLAPAGIFAGAVFLLPKVLKKPDLVGKIQLASTVALVEAVVDKWVKPQLPPNIASLMGEGMGYYGYGLGPISVPVAEYVDYDNRLGEYVDDNRYGGYEVTEALAADEVAYLERGGAGGTFSKTSLVR